MKPLRLVVLFGALIALLFLPVASAHAQEGGDAELMLVSEKTGYVASRTATSPACEYSATYALFLCPPESPAAPVPDPAAAARLQGILQSGGTVLMVPDSTNDRVMTFDAQNGTLIDADFVPSNSVVGTGINAILNAEGDAILLSDQIGDEVHEFTLAGVYVGTFAPAGGPDTTILNNVRGIALRPNGNLLVTSADATTHPNYVGEFSTTGTFIGPFIASASGGLDSPFDIYGRAADWLVSAIDSDAIHRYDLTGAPLGILAPVNTFPEQVTQAANGNILVANFSASATEGIYEFLPDGTFVDRYDPATLGGYRGVWELGNGNLLVTTGTGVHEISRANVLVETKISGLSGRFIEPLTLGAGPTPTPTATTIPPTATATSVPPTATATTVPPTTTATTVPPTATATTVPPTPPPPPTATLPPTSIELGGVSGNGGGAPLAGWLLALVGLALVAAGLVRRRR